VLVSFEILLGDLRGMTNLCIPYNALERIGAKLSANNWISSGRRSVTPETIDRVTRNLKTAAVEVVVRLADTSIAMKDLLGLRVGDIITTEKDVRSPLTVDVEGVAKYRARGGSYKGRKAICIEEATESAKKQP
jgi:flagellar motor switch protein FliM